MRNESKSMSMLMREMLEAEALVLEGGGEVEEEGEEGVRDRELYQMRRLQECILMIVMMSKDFMSKMGDMDCGQSLDSNLSLTLI